MELKDSKDGEIRVSTPREYIWKIASIYPDGFSIVLDGGTYYAVETTTGIAFQKRRSVYDLAATLRAPENDSAIRKTLEKIRAKYPAVNI